MQTQNLTKLFPAQYQKLFPLLNEIPDKPKQLFIKGNIQAFQNKYCDYKYVCMVGSRKASSAGLNMVQHLISGLKNYPIIIVSGFAQGVDSAVHTSALTHNIPTISFPGSGLDPSVLVPIRNRALAEEVIQSGNLLASEFEPLQPGMKWTFPKRNRILAGVSTLTIVIEASEKSGSLITANCALDYNRDVGAVPGNPLFTNHRGSNALLKDGAHIIRHSDDVLELLGFTTTNQSNNPQQNQLQFLTPEQQKILLAISQPKTIGQLMRETDLPAPQLMTITTHLEAEGFLKEEFGKLVRVK